MSPARLIQTVSRMSALEDRAQESMDNLIQNDFQDFQEKKQEINS